MIFNVQFLNYSNIGARLDKINNHIEAFSETKEYNLRCTLKKSLVIRPYMRSVGNRKRVLCTLM